jgi:hypothetical protein
LAKVAIMKYLLRVESPASESWIADGAANDYSPLFFLVNCTIKLIINPSNIVFSYLLLPCAVRQIEPWMCKKYFKVREDQLRIHSAVRELSTTVASNLDCYIRIVQSYPVVQVPAPGP